MQRSKQRRSTKGYSITSSARASSDGGTVRPSTLAVLRLTTISNFVGCRMGRSAGFPQPAGGVRAGVQVAARRADVAVAKRRLDLGKAGASVDGV
jgi:hypothetical protein